MNSLPLILEGGGLRLSFHRHGDRLAHTIGLVAGERLVPLLASVEGTPDDDWPPGPPLTTIETQARGDGRLAMLLGMAGRSHWSLSVELSPASRRLTFDVACRLKEPPARLASGYRTMVTPRPDPAGGLLLAIDEMAVRIAVVAADAAAGVARDMARLLVTPEGFEVAAEPGEGPLPRTVRWVYAITRVS